MLYIVLIVLLEVAYLLAKGLSPILAYLVALIVASYSLCPPDSSGIVGVQPTPSLRLMVSPGHIPMIYHPRLETEGVYDCRVIASIDEL